MPVFVHVSLHCSLMNVEQSIRYDGTALWKDVHHSPKVLLDWIVVVVVLHCT